MYLVKFETFPEFDLISEHYFSKESLKKMFLSLNKFLIEESQLTLISDSFSSQLSYLNEVEQYIYVNKIELLENIPEYYDEDNGYPLHLIFPFDFNKIQNVIHEFSKKKNYTKLFVSLSSDLNSLKTKRNFNKEININGKNYLIAFNYF